MTLNLIIRYLVVIYFCKLCRTRLLRQSGRNRLKIIIIIYHINYHWQNWFQLRIVRTSWIYFLFQVSGNHFHWVTPLPHYYLTIDRCPWTQVGLNVIPFAGFSLVSANRSSTETWFFQVSFWIRGKQVAFISLGSQRHFSNICVSKYSWSHIVSW